MNIHCEQIGSAVQSKLPFEWKASSFGQTNLSVNKAMPFSFHWIRPPLIGYQARAAYASSIKFLF